MNDKLARFFLLLFEPEAGCGQRPRFYSLQQPSQQRRRCRGYNKRSEGRGVEWFSLLPVLRRSVCSPCKNFVKKKITSGFLVIFRVEIFLRSLQKNTTRFLTKF